MANVVFVDQINTICRVLLKYLPNLGMDNPFILLLFLSFILTRHIFPIPLIENENTNRLRYESRLSMGEYSILNSSIVDGLNKYGGMIDFTLKMQKEADEPVWILSSQNSLLMEVLGQYVAEKSIELLKAIDTDNMNAASKATLKIIKSLASKIEQSRKNPIWEIISLKGRIIKVGNDLFIQTEKDKFFLTGPLVNDATSYIGKEVIISGYFKTADRMEIAQLIEIRRNTLEVFGMSHCPFAQRAEQMLFEQLDKISVSPGPALEIRFILYEKTENNKKVYYSLHGEEEVAEDLVQIVLRDRFPKYFTQYLRLRLQDYKSTWESLAEKIGIDRKGVDVIREMMRTDRDALLAKELEYARGSYNIVDGSPAFVWEGERIKSPGLIEAFKSLDASKLGECSK